MCLRCRFVRRATSCTPHSAPSRHVGLSLSLSRSFAIRSSVGFALSRRLSSISKLISSSLLNKAKPTSGSVQFLEKLPASFSSKNKFLSSIRPVSCSYFYFVLFVLILRDSKNTVWGACSRLFGPLTDYNGPGDRGAISSPTQEIGVRFRPRVRLGGIYSPLPLSDRLSLFRGREMTLRF